MKSRTSFFNPAVFKKDLTRFAPGWGLYTVGALLVIATIRVAGSEYNFAQAVAEVLQLAMPFINLGYALIVAQLLFGDLYNSRMCNALHALPLSRDSWLVTHVAAGLVFSLIPNAVLALVCMCLMGTFAPIALWWLLGSTLQYLFFFGLAVFCAMCVGNRFAMAMVYGIVNFLSLIAYWFVNTLYTPLLYGLSTEITGFRLFCPAMTLMEQTPVELWRNPLPELGDLVGTRYEYHWQVVPAAWVYPVVLAVLGLLLLGAALLMYRKRKLESAGDFVAFRPVAPVFLVLYTLCAGACFRLFFQLFGGDGGWVTLVAGLVVGFFTGRMLLERNVRVFRAKNWILCGGMVAVMLLSILITALDPLGLTRWVPKVEEVASVTVQNYNGGRDFQTEDPAQIQTLVEFHSRNLQDYAESQSESGYVIDGRETLIYTMQDGTVRKRTLLVGRASRSREILQAFYGQPELVLGYSGDFEDYCARINYIYVYDNWSNGEELTKPEQIRGLLEAVRQDCAIINLAQPYAYRDENRNDVFWLEITVPSQPDYEDGKVSTQNIDRSYGNIISVRLTEDCQNTLNYLEENLNYVPWVDNENPRNK